MTDDMWRPSASIANLRLRAELLQKIREFFAARKVLEVETPLICHTSVTDPHIQSIPVLLSLSKKYYLQTSPEYAMKRLLAAGAGPIYQICKAFRQEEEGRLHNPEFTMLEWYRPGFDHHALMQEMDALLQFVLHTMPAEKITYANVFEKYLGINPHTTTISELENCAQANKIEMDANFCWDDIDTGLQLLLTHCIEPQLGHDRPWFIYDFPKSQAALARIQNSNPAVASRFEVYFRGIELANGFHELQDAKEQRKRFENNLAQRKSLGLPELLIDEYFLASLQHGLPDCAGVALGIDRLVMLAINANCLSDVISFDIQRS